MKNELLKDWKRAGRLLDEDFFNRDTKIVAAELLGKILVKKEENGYLAARIVETEAYFGKEDPASHAYKGPTPRSAVMFGKPGRAYVYLCYGMHYLLNVVAEEEGRAGAVLIRAAEPLYGVDLMKKRRKVSDIYKLLSGPARLTQAFQIDLSYNAKTLSPENGIFLLEDEYFIDKIVRRPRIGVPELENDEYRCYVANSKFISRE